LAAVLAENAEAYARVALANIEREFPHSEGLHQSEHRPVPRPRDLHPAFYGSLDWHSCVEMHWVLARLLRLEPDRIPEAEARDALETHLSGEALAAEARFFADPDNQSAERPYGWGWALRLAWELSELDDPDAARWAANMEPLVDVIVEGLIAWLPKLTYPVRYGIHANPAFAFSIALPFIEIQASLLEAVREAAMRWYRDDADYPAAWEPSAFDFLSPALAEASLMASLLDDFPDWFGRFLPGIANGEPAELFKPVEVSDPNDGHIAHLHGLNLSRAWCFRRLANTLPDGDARVPVMLQAAESHAAASLDQAVDSNYHLEHWLAAYALLYLGEGSDFQRVTDHT
jgi:Protein of unknown function (DUF2891)